jgi:hypothetical protein
MAAPLWAIQSRLAKATAPKPNWQIIDQVASGNIPDDRRCPELGTRTRCSIALLLLLSSATAFGQSGTRAAAGSPKKATPQAASVLPPGLDDIEALTAALHKGESETAAEFEQRMAQLPMVGKTYAFAQDYPRDARSQSPFVYDAGAEVMGFSVSFDGQRFPPDYREEPSVLVKSRTMHVRHFPGTMWRSGQKFTVRFESRNHFGLIPSGAAWLNGHFQGPEAEEQKAGAVRLTSFHPYFSFPCGLTDAKSLQPYLYVALAGTLLDPNVYFNHGLIARTSTDSADANYVDAEYTSYFLRFELREVRAIDSRTGVVVARFSQ